MSNILSNIYKQGETVVSELQTMNRAMQLMGDKDSVALRQEDKHRKYEREQDKREKQSRDKLHHDIKNNVSEVANKTKKGEGTKSLSTGLASVIAGSVKAEEKKQKQQKQQQTPKDGRGGGARSISMYGAPDDAPTDTKPKVSHVDKNQNPPPKILGPIGNDNQELEARIELLEREIFSFESTKVTFTRPEGESKPNVKKFQVGGFSGAVPNFGQPSTGDHFYTSVDPGTYILNRNAVANMGFQSGGIPVALEKGEIALPPGSYDQGMMDFLNYDAFPRFQSGGIVEADHPHTGPGWSVGTDSQGRPSTLSRGAAEALQKMIQASEGTVKTSDITSAKRSEKHNARVGGVPNSNHLRGNAIDIHGSSKAWIKKHGEKYGFRWLNYPGHDGHFDYVGAPVATPDGITPERATPVDEGQEDTASTTGSEGGGNENIEPMTPEEVAKSTIEKGGGGIGAGISGFLAGAFAMFGKELGIPGAEAAAIFSGGGGGGGPFGSVLSGGFGALADQIFGGSPANAATNPNAAVEQTQAARGDINQRPTGGGFVNPKEVYDYIRSKGLSHNKAMGIVAGIDGESSFQIGVREKGHSKSGIGLFQYTYTPRKKAFLQAVPNYKENWKGQVDYAIHGDPETKPYLSQTFKSPQAAAEWWLSSWEKPLESLRPGRRSKYNNFIKQYGPTWKGKIRGGVVNRQEGGTVGNLMGMPSADTMNFFEQTSTQGMRQAQRGGVNVITLGGEGGGEGEPGLTTASSGNNLPMFDIPIRDNCPLSIYYRFEPSFNPSGMGAR